jgi:hypothetical protein
MAPPYSFVPATKAMAAISILGSCAYLSVGTELALTSADPGSASPDLIQLLSKINLLTFALIEIVFQANRSQTRLHQHRNPMTENADQLQEDYSSSSIANLLMFEGLIRRSREAEFIALVDLAKKLLNRRFSPVASLTVCISPTVFSACRNAISENSAEEQNKLSNSSKVAFLGIARIFCIYDPSCQFFAMGLR